MINWFGFPKDKVISVDPISNFRIVPSEKGFLPEVLQKVVTILVDGELVGRINVAQQVADQGTVLVIFLLNLFYGGQ